jgi:hypothetical protein
VHALDRRGQLDVAHRGDLRSGQDLGGVDAGLTGDLEGGAGEVAGGHDHANPGLPAQPHRRRHRGANAVGEGNERHEPKGIRRRVVGRRALPTRRDGQQAPAAPRGRLDLGDPREGAT